MKYYRVKNWEEFQHYKDRNPPWIKLHRALLDDYEFSALPDDSKAHLMLIWVFASQRNGRIPDDPAFLASKIGSRTFPDLGSLSAAGWIVPEPGATSDTAAGADPPYPVLDVEQDASKTLATCKQDASKTLALARSREESTSTTQKLQSRRRACARADGPTQEHLDLAKQLGIDANAEWASFWDRVEAKGKSWFTNSDAAFRNWLRQERKYAVRDGRILPKSGSMDVGEVI